MIKQLLLISTLLFIENQCLGMNPPDSAKNYETGTFKALQELCEARRKRESSQANGSASSSSASSSVSKIAPQNPAIQTKAAVASRSRSSQLQMDYEIVDQKTISPRDILRLKWKQQFHQLQNAFRSDDQAMAISSLRKLLAASSTRIRPGIGACLLYTQVQQLQEQKKQETIHTPTEAELRDKADLKLFYEDYINNRRCRIAYPQAAHGKSQTEGKAKDAKPANIAQQQNSIALTMTSKPPLNCVPLHPILRRIGDSAFRAELLHSNSN